MGDVGEKLVFTHVFTKENPGTLDDHYTVDKSVLGSGSYGQVMKGIHTSTGAVRAVKSIDVTKIRDVKQFENEMAIQQSLDHPNIVKLYEVFKDAKRFYLVMELCTGGELFDRIVDEAAEHEGSAFSERASAKIMQQILGAVHYMHGKNYVHRDIKPENFLLQNKDKDAPIKVIDFGLAKQFVPGESRLKTKAGTPYYVAPEVLLSGSGPGCHGEGYNEKCDIWSCGVLTYIILCGYPPFYGDRDGDVLKMVKAGKFEYPSPDWDSISAEAKDFINKMLTFDKASRPSAGDILSHNWLLLSDASKDVKLTSNLSSKLRKFVGQTRLKKVVLTLMAQHMREEEIEELKATFVALDKNNDGTLSQSEIREGMLKAGLKITADLGDTLDKLDTDASGSIDYTEFIAATLSTRHYLKKEALWTAFRAFDLDGSGEIDKQELAQVIKDENLLRVEGMIREVDLNGDGKISFEEFCAMMGQSSG